jgi:hypothetical protein
MFIIGSSMQPGFVIADVLSGREKIHVRSLSGNRARGGERDLVKLFAELEDGDCAGMAIRVVSNP